MSTEIKTASDTESAVQNSGTVSAKAADETLQLIEEYGASVGELTAEALRTLKRKLHLHLLSLLIFINAMLFVSLEPCQVH